MKAATHSCSGKKVLSKFRQNPQKTPAKEPILQQGHRFEVCNFTKKELPHRHTQALSYFIMFQNSKNTNFPEHLLMTPSVVNTVGNLTFHWSKKMSGSLKRPIDLRNLITSLITSLFKDCVRYIFAILFCMSESEHLRNKENVFYFTLKALFVLENQILTFRYSNIMTSSNAEA